MSDFVDTPMNSEFVKNDDSGGPGGYNGCTDGAFGEYRRTVSPQMPKEKTYDGHMPQVSGESDQGFGYDGKRR